MVDAVDLSNAQTGSVDMKIVPLFTLLQLATFNVRGLARAEKQSLLDLDCNNYHLDIVALQETKIKTESDTSFPSGNRLILMKQCNGYHGGLGFLVSKQFAPFIVQYSYVSDRVAFIDFKIPVKNQAPFCFRCVNIYSPTNTKAKNDNSLSTKFYKELNTAINIPSRHELFVMGDFNGKSIMTFLMG